MSGKLAIIPARAVDDQQLGNAGFRVLACLGCYADKEGNCWPSLRLMAKRLNLTRQAVQQSLRKIVALGYATMTPQSRETGASSSYHFRLIYDARGEGGGQGSLAPLGQDDLAGRASQPCREGKITHFPPTPPYIDGTSHMNVGANHPKPEEGTAVSFDRFWRIYPNRAPHSNPKKPAFEKFAAAVRRGVDPETIIRGAERYAAYVAQHVTDRQMIAQAKTWLHQERWEQDQGSVVPLPATAPQRSRAAI